MSDALNPVKPTTEFRPGTRGGRNADKQVDMSNLMFGKVQPQAVPVEEAVLGALMLDRDAFSYVMDHLKPEVFYLDAHRLIYEAMMRLFQGGHPVDILTVSEELKKMGKLDLAGGSYYLVQLTQKVTSAANIEFHARILEQKYMQREVIRTSTLAIRDAYEDTVDVFDLLDMAENNLFQIAQNSLSRPYEHIGLLAGRTEKMIELISQREDGLTGVPSGFTQIDRLTNGWQSSDLIVLGARPSMGKTAFTLALARNAAMDFKKGVAIFSLEMASEQLVQRVISMESGLSSSVLRHGKLKEYEWTQLHKTVEKLSEIPIYIDDTAGINIYELRAKARRLKKQYNIELIIIDYLQLMTASSDSRNSNREQDISNISRSLKSLAKELKVPVVVISQLSREVEKRGGYKKPVLSDLRESGAIEQDADLVLFLYRYDYYGFKKDEQGYDTDNITEVIIAKHRNGPLDTIRLRFMKEYGRFQDVDDDYFSKPESPSGNYQDPFAPMGTLTPPDNFIQMSSRINREVDEDDDHPFA